jgi:hypothetical protein
LLSGRAIIGIVPGIAFGEPRGKVGAGRLIPPRQTAGKGGKRAARPL